MPVVTEAHVVLVKNSRPGIPNDNVDPEVPTPWEQYLEQHGQAKPNRFQVHLVVSGFSDRDTARDFAEQFMSCGSLFVFNNKRRPIYQLEVDNRNE